jgi:hypothetical protein
LLSITNLVANKTRIEITLSRSHGLSVGEIFGVRNIENLVGFYKITEVPNRKTIVIQIGKDAKEPTWDASTVANLELFTEARYANYQALDLAVAATLNQGAKLWIDQNQDGNWETVEKQKQFSSTQIA